MDINGKIREFRLNKGLSLAETAKLCGLTKSQLSKIERGKQALPVSLMETIARSLDVDITGFFESSSGETGTSKRLEIVKGKKSSGDKDQVSTHAGYSYRPLVKKFSNKYMSPFLMIIEKGKTNTFTHDSEEFDYIIKGEIELIYEKKSYRLKSGDSFYIDSRIPHHFVNHQDKPAVMLAVNFNYGRF